MGWIPTVVSLKTVLDNSFRDFHVKGFDYICLKRSPSSTIKVYFFDGDIAHLPEVVAPHNHRYNFTTMVLSGSLRNWRYERVMKPDPFSELYERFDYMTPLNGGKGFDWAGRTRLYRLPAETYPPGSIHGHKAEEIHTIAVGSDQTVIMLDQGPDVLAMDEPTQLWRPPGSRQEPSLDGLYNRMDADHARSRLNTINMLLLGRGLSGLGGVLLDV
jgi:hypothetical protein